MCDWTLCGQSIPGGLLLVYCGVCRVELSATAVLWNVINPLTETQRGNGLLQNFRSPIFHFGRLEAYATVRFIFFIYSWEETKKRCHGTK